MDNTNIDSSPEEVILVEEQNNTDRTFAREMQCIFTWNITNFNSCQLEPGEEICSPMFNANSDKTRFYLSVFPNGENENDEFVSIHLVRLSTEESLSEDSKFYCKVSISDSESENNLVDEKILELKTLQRAQFNVSLQKTMAVDEVSTRFCTNDILTIICQMCTFNNAQSNATTSNGSIESPLSCGPLKTFSNDLRAIYRNGKFSDVTLNMVDGNISAHKTILCARSSVFAGLLESNPNREEISIPEFSKNIMDTLLSYIYTGEIDVEPNVLVLQLYGAAEKYNVVDLMNSIAPSKVFATTEIINEPFSYTWRLKKFTSVDGSSSRMIYSSKFGTDSIGLWSLSLYFHDEDDGEKIGIYLNKLWTRSQKKAVFVHFKIHLLDYKEQPCFKVEMAKSYKQCDRFGFPSFLNRNVLLQNQSKFLPGDTLTIRCDVKVSDGTCLSKINHSCSSSNPSIYDISDIKNLSDSFRSLYESKKNHDIIVTVDGSKRSDKTFNLHKTILCARSSRFASFFEDLDSIPQPHTINVRGIKREVLELLFLFIYTGELKGLSCGIAADLYAAAKHYNISDVNSICSEYLRSNLTVDNAFKIMELSATMEDDNLKAMTMDFICSHAEQLMMHTSQWSTFVSEHRECSSEILKSLTEGYRESKRRRTN